MISPIACCGSARGCRLRWFMVLPPGVVQSSRYGCMSWSLDVVQLLLSQNRNDRARIEALETQVADLRSTIESTYPDPREIPKAQEKKEILEYFESHDGETIYPSDLAEELRIDYDVVCSVIDALAADGEITEA